MKFLTKALLKSKIKSLGSLAVSVADHSLLGGAVSKYKGSDLSSKNKIPIIETISALIPILLLAALFAGWIDISQLKELLKVL
tara:strand:- start:16638 stop:16886 length:249 start_codon:yes stop_codon:yes gene_type:complete